MYSFDENELIVKTKENVCFDLKNARLNMHNKWW